MGRGVPVKQQVLAKNCGFPWENCHAGPRVATFPGKRPFLANNGNIWINLQILDILCARAWGPRSGNFWPKMVFPWGNSNSGPKNGHLARELVVLTFWFLALDFWFLVLDFLVFGLVPKKSRKVPKKSRNQKPKTPRPKTKNPRHFQKKTQVWRIFGEIHPKIKKMGKSAIFQIWGKSSLFRQLYDKISKFWEQKPANWEILGKSPIFGHFREKYHQIAQSVGKNPPNFGKFGEHLQFLQIFGKIPSFARVGKSTNFAHFEKMEMMGNTPNVWNIWDEFPDFASLGKNAPDVGKFGKASPRISVFFPETPCILQTLGTILKLSHTFGERTPNILELLSKTPEFWKY